MTIDSLIEAGCPAPSLIKIDANGAEPLVLKGGQRLWYLSPKNKNSPPTLIVKFNKQHQGMPPSEECHIYLPSFYSWFKIDGEGKLVGPVQASVNKPNPGGKGHQNLVAYPSVLVHS